MSALQFQRQLGVKRYETAFQLLHKLRAAMVRPDRDRIGGPGHVEVDETYVGGRTRGKGRGLTEQLLVVGAVEVRPREHPKPKPRPRSPVGHYAGRLRLRIIPERNKPLLEAFVRDSVEPGTPVATDGYAGYDGLSKLGYDHQATLIRGDHRKSDDALPIIHLVFSNLKTWLQGTHHGVSEKHLAAYLNEYVFRFNRRFYPMSAFHSVLGIATRVRGPTYDELYDGTWRHPAALPGWASTG